MNIKDNKNCKITINDEGIAVSEKEKTADKLFEELGYKKTEMKTMSGKVWGIKYVSNRQYIRITFDLTDHMICMADNSDGGAVYITVEELSAISEKCKELGWEE